MIGVEFPQMRDEVISALQSLACADHQRLRWGVLEAGVNYFENLTLVVNTLYDDTAVLPDPSRSVGTIIYEAEVVALEAVAARLSPMIDDLGNAPDNVYTADVRWPSVVDTAGAALAAMGASGL